MTSVLMALALAGQPTPPATFASRLLEQVNRQRQAVGAPRLRLDRALTRAAQNHADDMSRRSYFDHVCPDGRTFRERVRAQGYPGRALGENLAAGSPNPERVVRLWMASPGHRRNVLRESAEAAGVGFSPDGAFTVLLVGRGEALPR